MAVCTQGQYNIVNVLKVFATTTVLWLVVVLCMGFYWYSSIGSCMTTTDWFKPTAVVWIHYWILLFYSRSRMQACYHCFEPDNKKDLVWTTDVF